MSMDGRSWMVPVTATGEGAAGLARNLGVRRSVEVSVARPLGRRTRFWWATALAVSGMIAVAARADVPPIDLNTASQLELESLPGIGPKVASAIVERRTDVPFEKIEELLEVRGIGPKVFESLREKIVVSAAPRRP